MRFIGSSYCSQIVDKLLWIFERYAVCNGRVCIGMAEDLLYIWYRYIYYFPFLFRSCKFHLSLLKILAIGLSYFFNDYNITITFFYLLQVTQWSSWTVCDGGCHGGVKTRVREVLQYPYGYSRWSCYSPHLNEIEECPRYACEIDCFWGSWSSWTYCDPCHGRRSRVRTVEHPAMFGGELCEGSDYNVDSCINRNSLCNDPVDCDTAGKTFCLSLDECFEDRLRCNGDNDCRDRSDEWNCTDSEIRKSCPGYNYIALPNANIMGAGFDIIRGVVSGQILDNQKYGGLCETVMVGELQKYYRKPYNLQIYRTQVKVETTLRSYLFTDTMAMSDTKTKDFEFRIDAQPSIPTLMSLGSEAAMTDEKSWKKVIDSNVEDDYNYVKVESKIQVGHFKVRRSQLKLAHYFNERLQNLPKYYDGAIYSQFLNEFGTHYFTEGSIGGTYEVLYQFKSDDLRKTGSLSRTGDRCFELEAYKRLVNGINTTHIPTYCSMRDNTGINVNNLIKTATESMVTVHGGYSFEASALSYVGKDAGKSVYKSWADTVPINPTVFDFKLSPISELADNFSIRRNLDKSLQELFVKFDSEKCIGGQCKNGGKFIVISRGRECKCICQSPYYGEDCELRTN